MALNRKASPGSVVRLPGTTMNILASGADGGKEWFLVGAADTARVFLVLRTRATSVDVRWFLPNSPWLQCEPASALEADAARAAVTGQRTLGSLAWNDIEAATCIYREFRASIGEPDESRPN
jgi:hypothetical protein